MDQAEGAVGVMDSGVGGVSVLNALRFTLPWENFVYISDGKNAPYGKKSAEQVRLAVIENAEYLLAIGCKAMVVACNTATAVAVEELRRRYPFVPVVGLEPAVRPALSYALKNGGDVLVLATDVTVRQTRFCSLCESCCRELGGIWSGGGMGCDKSNRGNAPRVISLAAQELVRFVENGETDSELCAEYLRGLLIPFSEMHFSAVVAGCTHFPFARGAILSALGYNACFYDGALGASKRLERLLNENKITRPHGAGEIGWIRWIDTAEREQYAKRLRFITRQGVGAIKRKELS